MLRYKEQIDTFVENHTKNLSTLLGTQPVITFTHEPSRGGSKYDRVLEQICASHSGQIPFGDEIHIHIQSESGHPYNFLAAFNIGTQPGLCGCMYFTGLSKANGDKRQIGKWLFSFIRELGFELGYRLILCSNIVPEYEIKSGTELKKEAGRYQQAKFKSQALDNGYKVVSKFINRRTGNLINIFTLEL